MVKPFREGGRFFSLQKWAGQALKGGRLKGFRWYHWKKKKSVGDTILTNFIRESILEANTNVSKLRDKFRYKESIVKYSDSSQG